VSDTQQQRVNIQYSVNVEEVPELVSRLLSEAVSTLERASSNAVKFYPEICKQSEQYDNYSFGTEKIDSIRRTLADVDYRLSDIAMMLSGMQQLSTPQHQPAPTSEAIDQINAAAAMATVNAETLEQGHDDE
tara:strand:- start:222 stop:617 length:396 start_codon:yes stop_codon:yes gene_type:complete